MRVSAAHTTEASDEGESRSNKMYVIGVVQETRLLIEAVGDWKDRRNAGM